MTGRIEYVKQNEDWIEIEYVPDEHDEERDFQPSFWWNNQRYYLDRFIRVHNNPWMGGISDAPDYIHGYEADNYWHPLYVEVSESGDCVNVYEAKAVMEA